MLILKASREDLCDILELQYSAYQSEAELLNNFSIQPLTQTLSELEQEYEDGVVLKAVSDQGEIIGSVRGHAKGGTLYIGKLIVAPAYQGHGIGKALLLEIEHVCPMSRYELFTSSKSAKNISFYEKMGYSVFRDKALSPSLSMVYLEKTKLV
ncbi:MAG: GNAT family N-acetyltransferase [Eubacteriales bacterium]